MVVSTVIEQHFPPENVGIRREPALPEGVTQHHHRSRVPVLIFILGENAALPRLHAQHLPHGGGEVLSVQALGGRSVAFRAQVAGEAVQSAHRLKRLAAILPSQIVPGRHVIANARTVQRRGPQDRQAIRIRIGEIAQQGGIDDAEDGRVGADAQTQRQGRDDRESGFLEQHPETVEEVLPHCAQSFTFFERRPTQPSC